VRAEGLEPPRFSPPEPKSGASTSSATPASASKASRNHSGQLYSNAARPPQQKSERKQDRFNHPTAQPSTAIVLSADHPY
jgi:hypothetical protein